MEKTLTTAEKEALCDAITWLAMLERERADLPGVTHTTARLRAIVDAA